MAWSIMVRNKPAHPMKVPPKKVNKSPLYITDEMLAPYLPSLLPTSQVELTISCRNLLNYHFVGKSSPYCIVSMKKPWHDKYKVVTQTEAIANTQDPQWIKKVILDYNFESIQNLRFDIYEKNAKESDMLAHYETNLSELVSCHGCQSIGKLIPNHRFEGVSIDDGGEIVIVTEEVSTCKQIAEIQFSAENLPKPSWLRNNNPFLVISRSNEDSSYSVVTRTQPVHSSQNPIWKPITIRAATLCNGDFERSIKIDCYNFRNNGSHKLIGTCYTTLNNLNSAFQGEESMSLVNEEKQKTAPDYVATGVLKVKNNKITEEITFLDYIRHGTQMHFAVAIDFTASNGVHTDPKSLHYLKKNQMNSYELALRGVGEIVQQYDSSQLFPAFGFGAKLPPSQQVSFQFPLNENEAHPYCSSVEEILTHYRTQLNKVELYGPTNFAPVINNTITIARDFQDGKHYFVLLIITDGVISDMHLTKRAIIDASSLPISIIIVGVGDADFEAMDELDSDGSRLTVENRFAERDIVQFVPMRKFLTKAGSRIKSQGDLAEEVLAEIPEQLNSFMKSRGFEPKIEVNIPPPASCIVPTAPIALNTEV